MEKHEPTVTNKEEEKSSSFSLKNLLIRIICIVALSFSVKQLVSRGQMVFAAVVAVCVAGFFFSLVMYLVGVFKGK